MNLWWWTSNQTMNVDGPVANNQQPRSLYLRMKHNVINIVSLVSKSVSAYCWLLLSHRHMPQPGENTHALWLTIINISIPWIVSQTQYYSLGRSSHFFIRFKRNDSYLNEFPFGILKTDENRRIMSTLSPCHPKNGDRENQYAKRQHLHLLWDYVY